MSYAFKYDVPQLLWEGISPLGCHYASVCEVDPKAMLL